MDVDFNFIYMMDLILYRVGEDMLPNLYLYQSQVQYIMLGLLGNIPTQRKGVQMIYITLCG